MGRAIRLIVLIPLAIILIALALANRANVLLSLDPIRPDTPSASITVPLFVALLGALIAGVLIGGIAAWLGQGKWRRMARQHARELAELRSQQLRTLPPAPATGALVTMPPPERRRAV